MEEAVIPGRWLPHPSHTHIQGRKRDFKLPSTTTASNGTPLWLFLARFKMQDLWLPTNKAEDLVSRFTAKLKHPH